MACFVQILYIYRLLKDKKIFPYLPTLKLKNKSETDLFFYRPDEYMNVLLFTC